MPRSPPSSRWCPTREQLKVLHELYGRGLTNPNAFQIQKIAAHLSNYGKIQGKNVFYWFQNHKARQRQKLRKKHKQLHQQHLMQLYQHHPINYPSSATFRQLFNSHHSPQYLYSQGEGSSEVASSEGMMKQAWRHPKDWLMRSKGHDWMMVRDANPTAQCCRDKPLETLELFPLRSGIL